MIYRQQLKRLLLGLFALCYGHSALGQNNTTYRFSTDLTAVKDDMIPVAVDVPDIQTESITYYLPKIVPGTYSISDFGRFVEEFQAYDNTGKLLPVEKTSINGWTINNATTLSRITYWMNDTWDDKNRKNFLFEPGGTNIEDQEVFVLNTFGFIGYFEGMARQPFELSIKKPKGFYGSTSMRPVYTSDSLDRYQMPNYHDLADAPIMYNLPDTTWLEVGGADILVSVYAPKKSVESKMLAKNIAKVLEAQRKFLGGQIPVDKYAFLIYLFDGFGGSGYQGALEHSYSSLYFLPEIGGSPEMLNLLSQTVNDVAAHEFFHIVTPLNIHSEEIHRFDFINPKMSKHLWLYEGVTEYFAGLVLAQYGLTEEEEYIGVLREKVESSDDYQIDLPFTEMSKECLNKYEDQYGNVYEKGALIGLSLDLLLLEQSQGKYRLMDLMQDLAKEYGKTKPFKDDELFDKIEEITGFPKVGDFFKKYVAGSKRLPLSASFELVGYEFAREKEVEAVTLGNIGLGFDNKERLIVQDVSAINSFGKKMGYQEGDVIKSINEREIKDLQDAIQAIRHFQSNAQKGKKLKVAVLRMKDGKEKQKKLKAKIEPTRETVYNVLEPLDNPSEEQLRMKRIWLNQGN